MNLDYKGKTSVDSGVFYTPYVPVMTLKEDMTWKKQLLNIEFGVYNVFQKDIEVGIEQYATQCMQQYYPGPYRVVQKYLKDRQVIGLALQFDDPNEELVWLLQYT